MSRSTMAMDRAIEQRTLHLQRFDTFEVRLSGISGLFLCIDILEPSIAVLIQMRATVLLR